MVIEKKTKMPGNKAYASILQYDKMRFKIRSIRGPSLGESPPGLLDGAIIYGSLRPARDGLTFQFRGFRFLSSPEGVLDNVSDDFFTVISYG
jgi:hypothetical protein